MNTLQTTKAITGLATVLAFTVCMAQQEPSESEEQAEEGEAVVLPIQVETTVLPLGKHEYSANLIKNGPPGERNLSDLLQLNPAVDFSRNSGLSAGAASLRPGEISVHGQEYYQNLFLIDGADTTSDLNPGSSEDQFAIPSLVNPIGGSSPQGYYIDTSLVDLVQVYDSNVPAEFGRFTGGVVSAELKKANSGERQASITWGHRRDEWEEYHLTEDDITTADKYRGVYTPDYEKNNLSVSVLQPISENTGILIGLSRKTSEFAQEYEDDTDTIRQIYYDDNIDNLTGRIDTIMFGTEVGMSVRYSNRAHDGLTSTTYTGGFVREHEGYGFSVDVEPLELEGRVKLKFSYDVVTDSMDSESSMFVYHEYLENSGISRFDGAFGDMNQEQTRFSLSETYEFMPLEIFGNEHRFTIGAEVRQTVSFYERPETITYEQYYCVRDNGSNGCVDQDGDGLSSSGDEYLNRRFFYQTGKVRVRYRDSAAFVEDLIEFGPFNLRLGLRGDTEAFLNEFTISPRSVLTWKPQNVQDLTLSVGLNRYYGRSFLRYKLNDAIYGWRESYANLPRPRGRSGEEVPCSIPAFTNCTHLLYANRSGASDLKSPYSDELSIGFSRPFFGLNTTTNLVLRQSRDGVSRSRIDGLYYYNNDRESDTYSLTSSLSLVNPLELGPSETSLFLNLSYRESTGNSQSDDAYDADVERELIYYKNKLIEPTELPAWDYNIPFGISFHSVTDFPSWNIQWTNFYNIRAGGTVARDTRDNYDDPATGMEYDIYEDFDFGGTFTVNSQIRWSPAVSDSFEPTLLLMVNNLFDDVSDQSFISTRRRFTAGRWFSLELGVRF